MRDGVASYRKTAFTLIELLVVVGIIALLVGILLPVLSKVRERARELKCAANLHSIGLGLTLYVKDYRYYPGSLEVPWGRLVWPVRIRNMLGGNQEVFYCPSADPRCEWVKYPSGPVSNPATAQQDVQFGYNEGEQRLTHGDVLFSYGYNNRGFSYAVKEDRRRQSGLGACACNPSFPDAPTTDRSELKGSRVRHPSEMIAIADTAGDRNNYFEIAPDFDPNDPSMTPGEPSHPARIHRGGANVLFCDGHVAWYRQEDLIWRPGISTPADEHRLHRMWDNDQKDANGNDW